MRAEGELAAEIKTVWPSLMSLQAGHVLSLLIAAAAVAAASRVLGPESYGTLTLFTATAQYAVIVSVNWTSASVIRFGKDEFLRTSSVSNTFWARLAVLAPGLAIALLAIAVLAPEPPFFVTWPPVYVVLLAALILVLAIADHLDGILQATSQWNRYAWQAVVEKGSFLAGILVLALVGGGRSAIGAMALVIVAQLARLTFGGAGVFRTGLVDAPRIDSVTVRAITAYSWPLVFTFSVGYFSAFIEPFLIRKYLDVSAVGVYQVAFQISLFALALLNPVATLLFPAFTSLRVRNRLDLTVRVVDRVIPQFVFLVCVLLPVVMGITNILFEPVFGKAFLSGLQPLLILLAALSFQSIAVLYSPMLAAHDLTKESALLNTVGGILLHLAPQLLLIPLWGLNGAAASWLIWYLCSATVCVSVMSRRLDAAFYSILQYPAIALGGLTIFLTVESVVLQWLLLFALMGAALGWARSRRLFQVADLAIFDAIGLPALPRRLIAGVFTVLDPGNASNHASRG